MGPLRGNADEPSPERLKGQPPRSIFPALIWPGGDGPPSYKQEILESRVKPTHALATLLAGLRPKPAVLVCASAIGIYGSRGDELLPRPLCREVDFSLRCALPGKEQRSRPRTLGSG